MSKAGSPTNWCELKALVALGERPGDVLEGDGIVLVAHDFNRLVREAALAAREASNKAVRFDGQDVVRATRETLAHECE